MLDSDKEEQLMIAAAKFAGLDTALEVCPQSVRAAWEASRKSAQALESARRSIGADRLLTLHGVTP